MFMFIVPKIPLVQYLTFHTNYYIDARILYIVSLL